MTSKQSQDKGNDKGNGKGSEKDGGKEAGKGGGKDGGQQGGRQEPSPIDVQKSLKGLDFPASKEDILAKAQEGGASEDILAELEQIPEREYQTPADISKELGKLH